MAASAEEVGRERRQGERADTHPDELMTDDREPQ